MKGTDTTKKNLISWLSFQQGFPLGLSMYRIGDSTTLQPSQENKGSLCNSKLIETSYLAFLSWHWGKTPREVKFLVFQRFTQLLKQSISRMTETEHNCWYVGLNAVLADTPLSPKTAVSVPRLKSELTAVLLDLGFFSWKIRLGLIKNCVDLWHLSGINLLINSDSPHPPIILENQNHLSSTIQNYVLVQNLLQCLYLFLSCQTTRRIVGNYRIPLFCWGFFPPGTF